MMYTASGSYSYYFTAFRFAGRYFTMPFRYRR